MVDFFNMNLVDFIQLGIGGVAIVALVIIVKEFLKFVKHQEDNFTELITRRNIQKKFAGQILFLVWH